MNCGLLGRKLGHSYSPQIHSLLGAYSYVLFEKEPQELESFLRCGEFTGLNVTIPYKKDVIPYLDELSPVAQRLGAVNTIIRRNGHLIGHNTDYFGFRSMIQKSGLSPSGKKCLVLGSGGASNTATAVLRELGGHVIVISRTGENHYGNISKHADAEILVNCTPVGMYPHTGSSPVDISRLPHLEGVLDVIYNPARTQLLLDAENRGLVTMNGLWMLIAQAKESAEWFTGKPISDDNIARIHRILKKQVENIVLIGMPGCGKSSVGALLSERTGKAFVDADIAIAEKAGMSIPEIFSSYGEDGFRAIETQVLTELGKQSGLVIATGGGCVTQQQNYPLIHQNGSIYWLQRDLHKLPTDGRPLSQESLLSDMYERRRPMYEAFADHTVDNDGDIIDAVHAILAAEETL